MSPRWSPRRTRSASRESTLAAVALFALAGLVSISARVDAGLVRDRGTHSGRVPVLLWAPRPHTETKLLRGEVVTASAPSSVASQDGPSWDPSPTLFAHLEILRNPGERRAQVRKVVQR